MRRKILALACIAMFATTAQADSPVLNPVTPLVNGAAVTPANPLPVSAGGNQATRTDRSGTITAGGSPQVQFPANANRHGCLIQNVSTGDEWISELTTAVLSQPSIWIPPGSYWTCEPTGVPTGAISIIGATTGQAFSAREW